MNQVRKCKINSFYKTIPHSRILVCLSITDDVILKFHVIDIEIINGNIHDLGENVLYMISFENLIKDEQQSIEPILNDDE